MIFLENISLCDLLPKIVKAKLECEKKLFSNFRFVYKVYNIYREIIKYIDEAPFFTLLEDYSTYVTILNPEKPELKVGYFKTFILAGKLGCISVVDLKTHSSFLITYTIQKNKTIQSIRMGYRDFNYVERKSLDEISYNVELVNTPTFSSDTLLNGTKISYEKFNIVFRNFLKDYIKNYLYTMEV